MSRPRRSVRQEFYDVFDAWTTDEQAIVLDFLTELHRLTVQREKRTKSTVTHEQVYSVDAEPKQQQLIGDNHSENT